jgi:alpha-amylase
LLDVVYNHAGYGSHYVSDPQTKGWLRSGENGTCGTDDLTLCVAGLPDFKTELPQVADFLLRAQLAWAKKLGLDGFRLDTVKHVGHEFWQEHRRRTRAELRPDFFLLGEVWGGDAQVLDPYFAADELDAGFDFSFQGSVLGFLQGRGRTVAFDRYLKSREKVRAGHLLAHFLSSHDVPGALYQLGGDKALFRLAAVLQFASVGVPVIYYGEEVGRLGGDWPENRSDMPWGRRDILPGKGFPRDEALRGDYTRLIAIRRAHPALSRGTHEKVVADGDLLVFVQKDARSDDAVVVAINRGSSPAVARFAAPEAWAGWGARDVWNDIAVPLTSGAVETTVEAKTARIIVREVRR